MRGHGLGLLAGIVLAMTHGGLAGGLAGGSGAGPAWTSSSSTALELAGEDLSGIACPGRGACAAVGSYAKSSNLRSSLVLLENGRRWQAERPPLPRGVAPGSASSLTSVSCTSPGECTAVGYLRPTSSLPRAATGDRALVVSETASGWHSATLPLPAGTGPDISVELEAVSCPRPGDCVAVGTASSAPARRAGAAGSVTGLIYTESAGAWSARPGPLPPDASSTLHRSGADLTAISCARRGSCTAVGTYLATSGKQEGVLLVGADGRWVASRAPLPRGGSSMDALGAISCPTAEDCEVVGAFQRGGNPHGLLLAGRAGRAGHWTAQVSPDPGAQSGIYGISCVAASDCTAVGIELDAHYAQTGELLRDAGHGWQVDATTAGSRAGEVPDSGFGVTLSSISCLAAASCTAVGVEVTNAAHEKGVVLSESAGS